MTTTNPTSNSRFPRPHRAPGLPRLASANAADPDEALAPKRNEWLSQRQYDGWLAGRIRKRGRHWRQA